MTNCECGAPLEEDDKCKFDKKSTLSNQEIANKIGLMMYHLALVVANRNNDDIAFHNATRIGEIADELH